MLTHDVRSLASYHEIAKAYPSDKELRIAAAKKQANEEWEEYFRSKIGELLTHRFFRVVLDEGHMIRNQSTKSLFTSPLPCHCSSLTQYRSVEGLHLPDEQVPVDSDGHTLAQRCLRYEAECHCLSFLRDKPP